MDNNSITLIITSNRNGLNIPIMRVRCLRE